MTQEENLDSGHQPNNPVLDQVGDDTDAGGSISKNIAGDRNDLRNSCSSRGSAVKIESNKTVVRGSDLDEKVPVPDRDHTGHQSSLNVGNKSDHTVNASDQSIDMTVITQQNSNESLRDIQSNISDNRNKDNSNVINISDRAPTDNIGFHSEKTINTDLQSDNARSGNFPNNENSPSEIIAEKIDGNDLVRQENNKNNKNGVDQSANEQKTDLEKSKQIKDDDPIARLNALRANISNALKEVKAVLDQHAPQTDEPTDEKDDKRGDGQNDDGSVKFRFVRRVRKKSVIKLDDEEIICNVRPETAIVSNSETNQQLQTEKSTSPSKDPIDTENTGKSEDHSKKSESKNEKSDNPDHQMEKPSEDHDGKTKITDRIDPTQSDDRKDKLPEYQSAKSKDELPQPKEAKLEDLPKAKEDAAKSKEVKTKRKATLQKTASIDTVEKEKTRLKRASLNETKGAIIKATKLKRASICEGDLAKLPKPEKKLTKTLSKSSDTVKVKSKIGKTPSKDAIDSETQPADSSTTKPSESTIQIDPELKPTEIKMPIVATSSQDIKSQPQEVNKMIAKSQISHPITPNANAKIETSSKFSSDVVMPLISSADKSVSSESIELNKEKPAMAVTRSVKEDSVRNTTKTHPLVPNEKDKIAPPTTEQSNKNDVMHSKPGATSLTNSSVISEPSTSSTQGSQPVPKSDNTKSSKMQQSTAAEKPSTANLPRELIPLIDISSKKEPTIAQNKPIAEVSGNIALQELGSTQNKELKRGSLIRMDATETENLSETKIKESVSQQKNEEASTLQGANKTNELPKKAGSPSDKFRSKIPQLQSSAASSIKPKIQSAITSKVESKIQPEKIPTTKPDPKVQIEMAPSVKPEHKAQPGVTASARLELQNQSEPKIQREATASAQPEPKNPSELKPIAKSEPKIQPEVPSSDKPESKIQEKTSTSKPELKVLPEAKPTSKSEPIALTKQDEKTEPDQKDSTTTTLDTKSPTTSKPPQVPTSITSSTLPPLIIPPPEDLLSGHPEINTAESQETEGELIESSSSLPETPTTEDGKPAPRKKRKIKKKVIIRRIKRKLSRDNSTEEKVEPEICEKPIEFEQPEPEPVAEEPPPVPAAPKSCLKIRSYEPGDIVMYADRVRKIVKWKKGTVIEKITSISYKLDIEGEEKPAHVSYIKKYTDKKVQFGGKEYLEIDYEQENEEPEVEVAYNIWARV